MPSMRARRPLDQCRTSPMRPAACPRCWSLPETKPQGGCPTQRLLARQGPTGSAAARGLRGGGATPRAGRAWRPHEPPQSPLQRSPGLARSRTQRPRWLHRPPPPALRPRPLRALSLFQLIQSASLRRQSRSQHGFLPAAGDGPKTSRLRSARLRAARPQRLTTGRPARASHRPPPRLPSAARRSPLIRKPRSRRQVRSPRQPHSLRQLRLSSPTARAAGWLPRAHRCHLPGRCLPPPRSRRRSRRRRRCQ
mmetsp:Transcript_23429/g.88981  ORF Transcript_23429/g.88981 Transcript_23429/m.88981 type:complete len:251 (-) Transcript_23429:440-1192(-)